MVCARRRSHTHERWSVRQRAYRPASKSVEDLRWNDTCGRWSTSPTTVGMMFSCRHELGSRLSGASRLDRRSTPPKPARQGAEASCTARSGQELGANTAAGEDRAAAFALSRGSPSTSPFVVLAPLPRPGSGSARRRLRLARFRLAKSKNTGGVSTSGGTDPGDLRLRVCSGDRGEIRVSPIRRGARSEILRTGAEPIVAAPSVSRGGPRRTNQPRGRPWEA